MLPYVLVAAYAPKLSLNGEAYAADDPHRSRDRVRAAIATFYATMMLLAGGSKFLLLAALLYAPGTWLYCRARREQSVRLFTNVEWLVFAVIVLAAMAAIHGLASGAIIV